MKMKTKYTTIIAIVTLLASCSKSTENTVDTNPAETSSTPPQLTAVIEAKAQGAPQSIHIIRTTAKPGDTITISGKVMGSVNPFVEGRSAFILGDPTVLTACNESPDDHCTTPWDVCCDSKEDKARGTATIQVVDADGRVLKSGIEGIRGVEKLASLVITGTVAEASTPENLILNATAIDTE